MDGIGRHLQTKIDRLLENFPAVAIVGARQTGKSTLSSPALTRQMLEFCARHAINPIIEEFSLADVNDAFAHLEAGKARYRVVLKM